MRVLLIRVVILTMLVATAGALLTVSSTPAQADGCVWQSVKALVCDPPDGKVRTPGEQVDVWTDWGHNDACCRYSYIPISQDPTGFNSTSLGHEGKLAPPNVMWIAAYAVTQVRSMGENPQGKFCKWFAPFDPEMRGRPQPWESPTCGQWNAKAMREVHMWYVERFNGTQPVRNGFYYFVAYDRSSKILFRKLCIVDPPEADEWDEATRQEPTDPPDVSSAGYSSPTFLRFGFQY